MIIIKGKAIKIGNIKVVYWGKCQWYKFRWNFTHIDLGIISVYNLPVNKVSSLFWIFLAIIIKPLRIWYHYRYVYSIKGRIKNILNEPKKL